MIESLPMRKYVKVWVKKRKNNQRMKGQSPTVSYTLEWVEYGRRRFMSLGKHATVAFARSAAAQKERELNSPEQADPLDPITWDDFRRKYLDTLYPGHNLPPGARKAAARQWGKGLATMLRERSSLESFSRIVKPGWCHEITDNDRIKFMQVRLPEVGSGASVDAELSVCRHVFNVMEEWRHRPKNSNPFAGRGKATVGSRRKRAKEQEREAKPEYYTVEQICALLDQADKDVREADAKSAWRLRRLRTLVYCMAYTGARVKEVLYLEWSDIDWEKGIAWLYFKIEHDLKTAGSEAPFGLPDALLDLLHEWESAKTCRWVFPNAEQKPWVSAGPGYKPLDQLKLLATRAGIGHATWKMFRHSFDTHGKGRFRMTKEQMQSQLRHTTQETQKHYDHADLTNLRDAVKDIDFRR